MKKAVKGLIVAATVAAVVGVGAVSFAYWQGSSDTSVTINTGATGQIATVGAITVTPSAASGSVTTGEGGVKTYTMNKLCPVDQPTAPADCVKYWEFTLSSAATGGQSVKYTILGTLTEGTGTNATDLGDATLRWSTTAPTAAADGEELTGTAADITGTTVYVFLAADDTEAMNATISLTFAAVEAA